MCLKGQVYPVILCNKVDFVLRVDYKFNLNNSFVPTNSSDDSQ